MLVEPLDGLTKNTRQIFLARGQGACKKKFWTPSPFFNIAPVSNWLYLKKSGRLLLFFSSGIYTNLVIKLEDPAFLACSRV